MCDQVKSLEGAEERQRRRDVKKRHIWKEEYGILMDVSAVDQREGKKTGCRVRYVIEDMMVFQEG